MARLAELSNAPSERGRALLSLLLSQDNFMAFLDQHSGFEEDSTDFDYRPTNPTQALQTRAEGGEYTPVDVTPPSKQADSLSFHGFGFDIDDTRIADARRNLRDFDAWLRKEVYRRFRAFARLYANQVFIGPGTTTTLKGLSVILDGTTDIPGYTGVTGVIDTADWLSGSPVSFDLSNEDNWGTFIEKLIRYRNEVPDARGMPMGPELYARMHSIAHKKHILGESRDLFGDPVKTFAGIPMIEVREGSILTNEPDNTGGTPLENTTSLYIMRPGEGELSMVTNSGLEFDDDIQLEKKESQRVKGELRTKWKIEEQDAIRRFRNIKL